MAKQQNIPHIDNVDLVPDACQLGERLSANLSTAASDAIG
jgi:hypothetical protein